MTWHPPLSREPARLRRVLVCLSARHDSATEWGVEPLAVEEGPQWLVTLQPGQLGKVLVGRTREWERSEGVGDASRQHSEGESMAEPRLHQSQPPDTGVADETLLLTPVQSNPQ
jgi:hypothetical protein